MLLEGRSECENQGFQVIVTIILLLESIGFPFPGVLCSPATRQLHDLLIKKTRTHQEPREIANLNAEPNEQFSTVLLIFILQQPIRLR
jgi:hypothetical protein